MPDDSDGDEGPALPLPAAAVPAAAATAARPRLEDGAEARPVYVFLASQEAGFVTGEVYGVTDGEGVV